MKPTEKQRIEKISLRRQKQITAYKAQPVALVTRPLRRIDDATYEFNDKKERVPSRQYRAARIAANRGNGPAVKRILAEVQA